MIAYHAVAQLKFLEQALRVISELDADSLLATGRYVVEYLLDQFLIVQDEVFQLGGVLGQNGLVLLRLVLDLNVIEVVHQVSETAQQSIFKSAVACA